MDFTTGLPETHGPVALASQSAADGRSDRRFHVSQAALLYTLGAEGQSWSAHIQDISRGGMQLLVDRPVFGGPSVRIHWKRREIPGVIRYQREDQAGYRIGVELSASWESLVNEVLAWQSEELRAYAAALEGKNTELQQALEMAREASIVKSRFLASVSHEFRTPLNGIIGFSEVLQDEAVGPLSPEQKECVADLLGCSRHLLTLVNQILDLTAIEAGKMGFHYEDVPLGPLALEVIGSVRAAAPEKRVDVEFHAAPDLDLVRADPVRLKQVLYNFLSNAIKFTPDAGLVRVAISAEDEQFYRIEVEDNGIGISAADQGRLFAEFSQLGSTAKAQPGTGLGLAITKRIVEAQGGRVGVESALGRGSRFYAVLPRRPQAD